MRVISIICTFILCAWFICNPVEAQEVKIEPLPDPVLLAPLPDRRGYSTLPGWSAGYRFDFNLDTKDLSKLRLFMKRKSQAGHIVKFGWERQTGAYPNFFKSGTIDGIPFNNTGIVFLEQEIKF
tara:strand:- start:19 stop:390 length:372 start_codon:yes stop_codon:yes gene_type:complete